MQNKCMHTIHGPWSHINATKAYKIINNIIASTPGFSMGVNMITNLCLSIIAEGQPFTTLLFILTFCYNNVIQHTQSLCILISL